MKNYLCLYLIATLCPLAAIAQLGDKKDKPGQEQVDPIPAERIPPAPFLEVHQALETFQVADGFVIEPVAFEPMVVNPVALAFDGNGRMWVAEMRSYMPDLDGTGEDTPNGRIRVLEDTDGDGLIDKTTDFLDDLVMPRLVSLGYGGVFFNDGDALYFIKQEGLKPVGERELIDADYAKGGNPEHKANGMIYGHDNWYYNANSSNRYRRIDGNWVKEPTSSNRGQFGLTKDNAGRLYFNSNSTLLVGDAFIPTFVNPMRANQIGSNRVHSSRINPGVNRAYRDGTLDPDGKLANATAACGPSLYRGDNFPEAFHNYVFVCESSANLVKAIELNAFENFEHIGSHPYREKEFLTSTDERFRPVNAFTAPDGSLFIVDMYHGLIQHKAYVTSYLRNQYESRGLDEHNNDAGRIYRVRYDNKPLTKTPELEGKSAAELIPYLTHPNGFWRDTAQRLLVELGDTSVVPQLNALAGDDTHHPGQIHALWTLEGLGRLNAEAVEAALLSKDADVLMTAFEVAPLCKDFSKASVIDACLKTEDRYQVYKTRSLIRFGVESTWTALLDIIENPVDPELVFEIIFSVVRDQPDTFLAFLDKQSQASAQSFSAKLAQAIEAYHAKKEAKGNKLTGDALESFNRGQVVYQTKAACLGCHNIDGEGLLNLGPPLAGSDWVQGDPNRLIQILLHGLEGPIEVSGKTYTPLAVMPGLGSNPTITDQDLADVLTYVRNSWGNQAPPVKEKQVAKIRLATESRGEALYRAEDFN